MPDLFLARSCAAVQLKGGSEMLIDAMRIVARETGFTIVDHALGLTALRENDDRHLLFCLSTGEWSIFNGRTAQLVCGGYGLSSFLPPGVRFSVFPPRRPEAARGRTE